jgi:hypothetical protein
MKATGKIHDLPQEKYRADEGVSRSELHALARSPMHYKYAQEHQREDTPALLFGSALHCYVLEPERFTDDYIVIGKIDRRTTAGKAQVAEIEASGRIPVPEEDYDAIKAMDDSLRSNPYAVRLLSGEHEVSYFTTDPTTGIRIKCRPDCRVDLGAVSVIVDLKTTRSAQTDSFSRSCIEYGYDLQAAMYKQIVDEVEGKPHRFVFVAVEKDPPYACNVLEADELMLRKGADDLRGYLMALAECRRTDNWYGYNGADGKPNVVGLPAWLAKEYE